MFRTFCCLLLSGVILASDASPDQVDLRDQANDLIARLNAGSAADRQTAEEELIKLGVAILDHIPTDTNGLPQEMKLRLRRIRERLEQVASKTVTQATAVTLTGKHRLSAILREFESQTQNRVIDFRNQIGQTSTDPEVDVAFEKTPFWQALDFVMAKTNLMIDPYGGGVRTLALIEAEQGQQVTGSRIAYSGLFRFDPQTLRAVRSLRNPLDNQLVLTVEITWEPHMTPLAILHPIESLSIRDQNDDPMQVDDKGQAIETSVQNEVASVEVDLPFVLPKRSVGEIKSLKGEIIALVPGRDTTFTFANLERARNVERDQAGAKVVLQRVRKNANVQQVRILIQFDDMAAALKNHRGWVYSNKAYLQDDKGRTIEAAGFETTRQQRNEVGLAYNFVTPSLDGYSFVYKTPAAIIQLPVKYELHNIALP